MSGPTFEPGETLRTALVKMTRLFAQAGLETPETDARFLLRGVLGLDARDLLKDPERQIGAGALLLGQAVSRHLAHEPVSRILGEREFYGRMFEITPDVLDPRADTETLVDEVLSLAAARGWGQRPIRIADIGLGSGAILVTLLAELPLARGVGTDISSSALLVALRNAHCHGVAGRIELVETSILNGVAGPFDIVVSNPPYIPRPQLAALDASVLLHDPLIALDGGPDGLQFYREIARQINSLDITDCVVLEAGAGQAADIAAIFGNFPGADPLWKVKFRDDLGGHARCVTLERHSATETSKTVGSSSDKL